jgi:hypothetical protein
MDPQQPDPDLMNISPDNLYDKEFSDLPQTKKEGIPKKMNLSQNYPNPFNPNTTIEFSLPKTNEVTLKIYNILGEDIATLVSDRLTAGIYTFDWDASNMAGGVYLYRLFVESLTGEAGEFVETRKMILMR